MAYWGWLAQQGWRRVWWQMVGRELVCSHDSETLATKTPSMTLGLWLNLCLNKPTMKDILGRTCYPVAKSCLTLCDPMDCSPPGFPVLLHLLELAQTHVHWINDPIQPSHPLSPSSPPALNLSQHQGLFQWISSSPQLAKVLEQLGKSEYNWRLDMRK